MDTNRDGDIDSRSSTSSSSMIIARGAMSK